MLGEGLDNAAFAKMGKRGERDERPGRQPEPEPAASVFRLSQSREAELRCVAVEFAASIARRLLGCIALATDRFGRRAYEHTNE